MIRSRGPFVLGEKFRLIAAAGVTWLAGMLIFYRTPLFSGFEKLHGNDGDPRLLSYLNEHWLLVLKGKAAWRDPSYFFPVANDLGNTDAFFLFQPIYAPLRLLGADQFSAFQLVLMVLTTIGFFSCMLMLIRVVGVRPGVAVAGAFAFAFANNVLLQVDHAQLYAVHFIPVIVLFAFAGISAVGQERRRSAALWGAAAGAMVGALLFTSYYTGWFLFIVVGTVFATMAMCAWPVFRRAGGWLTSHFQSAKWMIAGGVMGFAVAALPFFATYLPIARVSTGAPYEEVMSYMQRPGDLLNMGGSNIVWGWLRSFDLYDTLAPGAGERSMALTPLLVVSTIVGLVLLFVLNHDPAARLRLRLAVGGVLGVMALTMLTLRFGDFSMWEYVRRWVPGADAIRAMARIQMTLGLVMVGAWAVVMDELLSLALRSGRGANGNQLATGAPKGHRLQRLSVAAVLAVLVLVPVEQVSSDQLDDLNREAQRSLLESVPPVPSPCSAFYVANPPEGRPSSVTRIDAMLISHRVGLPTLNGYSGVNPPGWTLVEIAAPGYESEVAAWIASQGVPGTVCRYDLANQVWTLPEGF